MHSSHLNSKLLKKRLPPLAAFSSASSTLDNRWRSASTASSVNFQHPLWRWCQGIKRFGAQNSLPNSQSNPPCLRDSKWHGIAIEFGFPCFEVLPLVWQTLPATSTTQVQGCTSESQVSKLRAKQKKNAHDVGGFDHFWQAKYVFSGFSCA